MRSLNVAIWFPKLTRASVLGELKPYSRDKLLEDGEKPRPRRI